MKTPRHDTGFPAEFPTEDLPNANRYFLKYLLRERMRYLRYHIPFLKPSQKESNPVTFAIVLSAAEVLASATNCCHEPITSD
jgi:hypothetical protein